MLSAMHHLTDRHLESCFSVGLAIQPAQDVQCYWPTDVYVYFRNCHCGDVFDM